MKRFLFHTGLFLLLAIAGCNSSSPALPASATTTSTKTLADARAGFKTNLIHQARNKTPVEAAPLNLFNTLKYPSPAGQLAAYLTPDPGDGTKRPAIIWITGGDCNSIGDVWTEGPPENDQTAAAFRKAGIVMMFPSLRGGNDNPGSKEGFLGEAADVLAAADFLAKQSYVDPQRIYLGGHSTGGTLVLLVAELTDRFRAVFAFGPAGDVSGYGERSGLLPFNTSDEQEVKLRSPGYWLHSIQSPVWIIEGEEPTSNVATLRTLQELNKNSLAHFVAVPGVNHFSVLKSTTDVLAQKILNDEGATTNISLIAPKRIQNSSQ